MFSAVTLLLLLLGAPPTVSAHPGHAVAPVADAPWTVPLPPIPELALALGLLAVATVARRARGPRWLPVVLSLLLVILACETALHSAHHLTDPRKAEHCVVYSASLHLGGLEALRATPELSRSGAFLDAGRLHEGQPFARALAGPSSRAPPVLPA